MARAKGNNLVIVALVLLVLVVLYVTLQRETETTTQRSCVTECSYEADDIYAVTVEYDGNLYEYYDSVPRETGTVLMVTYTIDGMEIVDVRDPIQGK